MATNKQLESMIEELKAQNAELMAQYKRDHESLGDRLNRERAEKAIPVEEQTKLQIVLAGAQKDNRVVSFDYLKITPASRKITRHHVHVEVITEKQFFGQDYNVETRKWTPLAFNLNMVMNVEVSPKICTVALPEIEYVTDPKTQGELLAVGASTWKYVSNPF